MRRGRRGAHGKYVFDSMVYTVWGKMLCGSLDFNDHISRARGHRVGDIDEDEFVISFSQISFTS